MEQNITWEQGEYWVTTDKTKFDIHFVHNNLTQLYWARGITLEKVRTGIEHSLCFALFHCDKEIGFSRLITDFSTFAYLCDVFIVPDYQKRGLGRWLMECVLQHPIISHVKRVMLVTSSAGGLYEKFGFEPVRVQDFVWTLEKTKASE
ncbi:GNAT family N-acetyltransferase [Xenorhabdus bovienii]|uniref:GNAT family N-acetyltransferase n=1 Tax=Xenorhabdus bovienii TaxID=40576 RepID=UPI0023B26115|nr:GNAT family N-acetyltransferase [Xenorhabdus bovienii]MDE9544685.1 GNAT family N-acetyltransferase [Xenorhabdus bovienii]MDE9564413.1 GNAT family N-acetyltransferase [Xenorhabdus bovienii]